MKKFLSLIFVVIFVGVLIGCGSGSKNDEKKSVNLPQNQSTEEEQNDIGSIVNKHDKSLYIPLPQIGNDGYASIDLDDAKYAGLGRDEGWRVIGDAVMVDIRNMWERDLWREDSRELGQPIEASKEEAIYEFRKNPRGGEEPYNENFPNDVLKIIKDKNTPVVLICHTGGRTSSAVEKLVEAGFSKVYHIKGGMKSWTKHFDTKKHSQL